MTKQGGHKWFAAFYDRLADSADRSFMGAVRLDVAGGASGRILEIGAGTGANFLYYAEHVDDVVATEPDPFMLRRAILRAQAIQHPIAIEQARAEDLPFRDACFDTVVSTLVLCSVQDPAMALSEIRRVLKPGGEFRFYEHVRYHHAIGGFFQNMVTPVWRWAGAGCHPNRDTTRLIRQAGFRLKQLDESKPLPPLPPMAFVRPHIKGVAVAP